MKKFISIIYLVFVSFFAFAQQGQNFSIDKVISSPPSPARLVNDYANILTPDQNQALERKLVQFDDTTSNQVLVVIVPRLGGKDVADVAIEIGRAWGVGGKKNNNGVVLLVSVEDRKLNISPGYGLEKSLPDITCQQIIENIIVPNFRGNDYYAGINEGTDAIIQATKGEFQAPENYHRKGKSSGIAKLVFFIIIIVVFLAISSGGRGGGGSFMSRRGAMPFILGSLLGSAGRGGLGGGGGGGWSGGGGGGGGFGGFGGGSFGGGGSSGSW
jgi:uncharacterized protein